jgi:hypothetical protein
MEREYKEKEKKFEQEQEKSILSIFEYKPK